MMTGTVAQNVSLLVRYKCRVRNRQHVQLPSPTQVGDTITLEIDGREIDIEVETVPDVYENYLRKQG